MVIVRTEDGLRARFAAAALLAVLAATVIAPAATTGDARRSLRTSTSYSHTRQKSILICTIPGNTIIEAPLVRGDVSSAWGSASYFSASSYPNDGCISTDGYWRPACPAIGAAANTSLPENICISNKCGTSQKGGIIPPLVRIGGRRLQSRALTLIPGYPAAPACCPTYTSELGDTVASIAAKTGVKPLLLTTFNRLASSVTIFPKHSLNVPCPRALLFFETLMLSVGTLEKPTAFNG